MTDMLGSSSASMRSTAGASAAAPAASPAASPKELLLLAQAVYASGATQAAFEAFPTLLAQRLNPRYVPHPHVPPPPAPPALATPAACMQQYKALLDALEPAPGIPNPSLSASMSTIELKRPQARTHLRLARKAYTERLIQVKDQLAAEEAPMRALLQEIKEIQSGAWDARLTESYTLVNPSDNPDEARYVYDPAGTLAAKESARTAEESMGKASHSQPSGADGAVEGSGGASNASASVDAQEASTTVPPTQGLADIPEEETEKIGTTAASGSTASIGRKGGQATIMPAVGAGSSGKPISGSSSGAGTAAGKPGPSKPSATERRSSGRTSRHSISALSDIAPPPPPALSVIANSDAGSSSNAAKQSNQLAPPSTTVGDSATTAAADASPTSAAMELDSSRDSQPPGSTSASTSAALAPTSRRGRGGRRASVSTSRGETNSSNNKRKRTATPLEGQGSQRGPSPALSDRSRSKRIKTEEPDSSSGTPGAEGERADAAARRFRNSAPHLISQMHGSIHSTFFKDPVRAGDALNYFEIVKRPMDLKTLLQKVKAGQVTCTAEFKRDVALIFANAVMYNGTNHDVARDARAMWADVQALFSVLEQAEQRAT